MRTKKKIKNVRKQEERIEIENIKEQLVDVESQKARGVKCATCSPQCVHCCKE